MDARSPAQITTLFSNSLLSRIERLRLNASRRFTNRSRGEHLSGKGGSSTDFADYRNYVEGDDVRFVDWNIFSRINRPYLKLFHQEEDLHVVLIIDASASMGFDGKLERARQLAAAFAVMGLMNNERVSCWALNRAGDALRHLDPCSGRASMRKVFGFLEQVEAGGDEPIEQGIERVLHRHRGRGVAILLSDFLSMGDPARALNMLFSAGLETFGLQVLGASELEPDFAGDSRFVDTETGATLDVSAAVDLLTIYHEYRIEHETRLSDLCRGRAGRFLSCAAAESIETLLFDQLQRRGWVR